MNERNPAISKGVDWSLVWIYLLLAAIGITAIFAATYKEGDPLVQSFLRFKTDYSKGIDIYEAPERACAACPLRERCTDGMWARHVTRPFEEDLREDDENVPRRGTVYIQSTGLLSGYRGRGLGRRVKEWEIEYARRNGFRRVVTNCREGNARMIGINEKYGFRAIRRTDGYYEDGEATVVMELVLE